STPLDLFETGKALKFQAERPHLVSLGSGRLSTAITLLPLPEGKTTLGHGAMDISIQGPGIAAQHCFIENRAGVITLHPCGNQCSMDGLLVAKPVRLSQGKFVAPVTETAVQLYHPSVRKRAGVQGLQKCSDTIHHLWVAIRWTGLYFCGDVWFLVEASSLRLRAPDSCLHCFKLTIKKSYKAWGIIDEYSMNKGFTTTKQVSLCMLQL
ncbi:hypothetical protein PO909_003302, partial [Leuciscus waleckii]